ncbi:MAG: class I SAM-dependent methyltransferase [Candidatus Omnitrophota bacterium]
MKVIFAFYKKFRRLISRKGEEGEYSSGYLPSKVRDEFLNICKTKTGKILEIGCGEGLFISNLFKQTQALKIFAVDILKEGLLRAKERLGPQGLREVQLIESDGGKLSFKDSVFDYVVCMNALFNQRSSDNVKQIIEEAVRVAKKDAEIIVDIRNKKDLLTSLRYKLVKFYDFKCAVPLRQYDPEEIINIFEISGAKVTELKPMRAFLNLTKPITIIRAKKL